MRNMVRTLILLGLLLWIPFSGYASCGFTGGATSEESRSVSFGNVIVQRDVAVGETIATANTGAYNNGNGMVGCSENWVYRFELSKWKNLSSAGDKIYETNLPGVGIRMTEVRYSYPIPFDWPLGSGAVGIPDGVKVDLIKTGDIQSGTLDSGLIARASVANQFYFASVNLSGTNTITSVGCTIASPDPVNVVLGDHNKNEFVGGSWTEWKTFNIDLQCDKSARINVRIDATQDASNIPGVMGLDNDGRDTTANGVGVELWYRSDNSAVQFGQQKPYYTSPYGGHETVQLQARYRQTADTVTAGQANATATFTLTYQ